MVDVGMREQDLLERQAALSRRFDDARQVAAGIDDGGLHRLVAPDEAAVLLECGDGEGAVTKHGCVLFSGDSVSTFAALRRQVVKP
jgi:hypothetical protein